MNMKSDKIPQHVAIIMDGNRRWAKKQGLSIIKGHRKTAEETIERLADYAIKVGIKYLTLWAFSTENWQRDSKELDGIMGLFRETFSTAAERLHKKGVRVHTIGDLSRFPKDIRDGVEHWKEESSKNKKLVVTFALNYGGRDEILRAVKGLITQEKKLSEKKITPELLEKYLDTKTDLNLPDPDLIIRPGGEQRLSGYLPWQGVYSELYFCSTLMPDFNEKEFAKALAEFASRQRRFGQ
jgi:undecaprenyl diphosphate synthase